MTLVDALKQNKELRAQVPSFSDADSLAMREESALGLLRQNGKPAFTLTQVLAENAHLEGILDRKVTAAPVVAPAAPSQSLIEVMEATIACVPGGHWLRSYNSALASANLDRSSPEADRLPVAQSVFDRLAADKSPGSTPPPAKLPPGASRLEQSISASLERQRVRQNATRAATAASMPSPIPPGKSRLELIIEGNLQHQK